LLYIFVGKAGTSYRRKCINNENRTLH